LTYKADTLCGMFHKQAERYKNLAMLRGKFNEEGKPQDSWRLLTWGDVQAEVVNLGRGLVALGLKPGDRMYLEHGLTALGYKQQDGERKASL